MTLISDRPTARVPPPVVALRPPWDRRRWLLAATLVWGVAAGALSVREVGVAPLAILAGVGDIWNLLARMLPPELVDGARVWDLILETFFMAFLGTLLAVVLSLPIAFLAARNTTPSIRFAYPVARGIITASRAIPDVVFALIFVRALGLGVLPGVLALGLHSIGMLGKLFADAIEEIDEGAREAVTATGASRIQAIIGSVVPQIVPSLIGITLYRLDINVRTSTVLGFVGAGGIGQELRSTLGALRYPAALGIVGLIFFVILAMEAVSVAIRRTLLQGEERGRPRRRVRAAAVDIRSKASSISPPWTAERRWRVAYAALFAVLLVVSVWQTGISPAELFTSLDDLWRIVQRFVPPDFSTQRDVLLELMVETLAIGMASTLLGVALAMPIAFFAAGNVAPWRWVYLAARAVIVAVRGVPEFILAVVFVAALGLGPFPGTLALAAGTAGFMAKLLADALEEIQQGPRDAVDAVGASRLQQTFTAVVPQVMPAFVGHALYMLDVNIRSSVVLGIVGAGGVGFLLVQSTRTLEFQVTSAILIAIFVVVYAIERFSGWLRKQLI